MKTLLSALLIFITVSSAFGAGKISDLPLSTAPSTNTFIEIADMDAVTKSEKYLLTNLITASTLSTSTNKFVAKAGDTMTGNLTLSDTELRFGAADAGHGKILNNVSGIQVQRADGGAFGTVTAGSFATTLGGQLALANRVFLLDDAANTLALRNGANAQAFNVYSSYTDAANYSRLRFSIGAFSANAIVSEAAGSGTALPLVLNTTGAGNIQFQPGNANRWYFDFTTGSLLANTDNTVDIGASGANRPRNLYTSGSVFGGLHGAFSGNVTAGSAGWIGFSNRSFLESPADGVLQVHNGAGTDFGRLQFGGTTASFPSLKRNGAGLDVRLADDSDYGVLNSAGGTMTGGLTIASNSFEVVNNGGVSKFKVNSDGSVKLNSGGFTVASSTDAASANRRVVISNSLYQDSTSSINWSSSTTDVVPIDLTIVRDAANTLALRNGANAQTFNVYRTYTDGANYERASLYYDGPNNAIRLSTQSAGTGAARELWIGPEGSSQLEFVIGNTRRWQVDGGGNFTAFLDNTYDIGASGANRPRNGFFSQNVTAKGFSTAGMSGNFVSNDAGAYYWDSRAIIRSPADGVIKLGNNAENDFGRIVFGGITASFPSLKRNGTALNVVLADDTVGAKLGASLVGGFDATGSDVAGTNIVIQGGIGTGTAKGGDIIDKTSLTTTTGSTAQSLSTRRYESAKFVDLTESTATPLLNITCNTNEYISGTMTASIFATDGNELQAHTSGTISFAAVNKAGTITATIAEANQTELAAVTTGTLTDTYTIVQNGNAVDIKVSAVSSLTQTVLRAKWIITALNSNGAATVTPQ